MADCRYSDSTLPTLQGGLDTPEAAQDLVLTVIYHPDMSRIGERCVFSQRSGAWVLGRNTPEFGRAAGISHPLGDRHVSREALSISRDGASVVLRRNRDSCRCRVAGEELIAQCKLDTGALVRGVPILLAHTMVLLLSLSPPVEAVELPDCGLLGNSAAMVELRRQLHNIAAADLDVLLLGETGTGKELVAHAIHRASRRRDGPMVNVNVAAIPSSLAPAALFGSARGAFTGADRLRQGYFQQAGGGTLFLDEVGDAPDEVQPQLLRALQQREIQPVGGSIEKVDVRVISATDAALEGKGASFKSALRHRLGALELNLPPLREHREDAGVLMRHYLEEALASMGRQRWLAAGHGSPRDTATCALLFHGAVSYRWPGNVRQLINVCNQVAVASETGLRIPPQVATLFAGAMPMPEAAPSPGGAADSSLRPMRDISDEEFDRAMHDSDHEVAGVAQRLGVSRQSVYRRMASSGVYRKASDLPEPELLDAVHECGGDTLAASRLLRVSVSGLRSRLRGGNRSTAS